MKKIFLVIVCVGLLCGVTASAKTAINYASQKDITKYGLNPWSKDTDNDGYADDWEIKFGYCPTSQTWGLKTSDSECQKGKIDLKKQTYTPPENLKEFVARDLRTFSSCAQMRQYLNTRLGYLYKQNAWSNSSLIETVSVIGLSSVSVTDEYNYVKNLMSLSDYSSTNVQVAGVDEGDLVETNGKDIFSIFKMSGVRQVVITSAKPAEKAAVKARIDLDYNFEYSDLFLSGNYLVVIGEQSLYSSLLWNRNRSWNQDSTLVQIFNVANSSAPKLVRTFWYEGSLLASRATNGYGYLVLQNSPINFINKPTLAAKEDINVYYKDIVGKTNTLEKASKKSLGGCNIQYLSPAQDLRFLEIVSFPLNGQGKVENKIIVGGGNMIYMSAKNLYVFSPRYSYYPEYVSRESTDIYKFNLEKGKINLVANQVVPGTVLNQFSVDENKEYLRVFTTENRFGRFKANDSAMKNGLYVYDKDLTRIGWYDTFGEGEKIYSARFIGDRAYAVTFKETDPLFVFDLSVPTQPKLLGEMKIPGFSTYLHPYDANHIIGFGYQATIDTSTPGFAWYQGLKIGLFDVSDPTNPIQLFSREVGDRGSYSLALSDHHAFLFSPAKNLLAFPVNIYQLTAEQKKSSSTFAFGEPAFVGLYVYNLDLKNGFSFLGGVSFDEKSSGYLADDGWVTRSLYIGDNLYAFTNSRLGIYSLKDLSGIKELDFTKDLVNTLAYDSKRLSDLRQIQTALELHYSDNGFYPVAVNAVLGKGNYSTLTGSGWHSNSNTGESMIYMATIPADPHGGKYIYNSNKKTYTITAVLERGISSFKKGKIKISPDGIVNY